MPQYSGRTVKFDPEFYGVNTSSNAGDDFNEVILNVFTNESFFIRTRQKTHLDYEAAIQFSLSEDGSITFNCAYIDKDGRFHEDHIAHQ